MCLAGCVAARPVVGVSLIVILLLFPLGKTIKASLKPQPVSAKLAGEWLRENPELTKVQLIANERKIPFYAGRGSGFELMEFTSQDNLIKHASQPGEKLVSYFTRKKSEGKVPAFAGYELVNRFTDDKYVSLLFYKKG